MHKGRRMCILSSPTGNYPKHYARKQHKLAASSGKIRICQTKFAHFVHETYPETAPTQQANANGLGTNDRLQRAGIGCTEGPPSLHQSMGDRNYWNVRRVPSLQTLQLFKLHGLQAQLHPTSQQGLWGAKKPARPFSTPLQKVSKPPRPARILRPSWPAGPLEPSRPAGQQNLLHIPPDQQGLLAPPRPATPSTTATRKACITSSICSLFGAAAVLRNPRHANALVQDREKEEGTALPVEELVDLKLTESQLKD